MTVGDLMSMLSTLDEDREIMMHTPMLQTIRSVKMLELGSNYIVCLSSTKDNKEIQ